MWAGIDCKEDGKSITLQRPESEENVHAIWWEEKEVKNIRAGTTSAADSIMM